MSELLAPKRDANDAAAHRYSYDVLNRPTAVFYTASGPADVEYDYDTVTPVCAGDETSALGRVTAMRAEGTELQYCYDRFGQIVRKVQTVAGKSFTLRYAYNKAGLLQAITYPDGAVADYSRDSLGRIQEIQVTPVGGVRTKLLGSALYQPFGPSIGWSFGNGRHFAIDSDLDYRTQSIRDMDSGGLSLGYVYNEVGEIKELKDGLLSASLAKYDYDTLGRLKTTRDGPTGTALETYGYDATGNRTSLLRAGITDTYNYPSTSHRLSSIGGTARSYDAVGNTIAIGGTAKEYVYTANDRMKQVKQGGVVTMGYRYNAKGERVAAISGDSRPVTTYTLYDEAGHWIGDYDSTGAAIQQAIWMEDAPVGLLAGAGSAQSLKYVQPDHLGTPRSVIDPSRNVAIWTWDAKSEAFGNSPPNQDPDLDGAAFVFDMRFPGQRYDPITGSVYNYFRDYDPTTGRYLQSDPIGLGGGTGTFAYVGGNPFRFSDAFGLASVDNWENKYVHKVTPPQRSPDDWLGPVIGVGLGVVALPLIWELGALSPAVINPYALNNVGVFAAEAAGVTGAGHFILSRNLTGVVTPTVQRYWFEIARGDTRSSSKQVRLHMQCSTFRKLMIEDGWKWIPSKHIPAAGKLTKDRLTYYMSPISTSTGLPSAELRTISGYRVAKFRFNEE